MPKPTTKPVSKYTELNTGLCIKKKCVQAIRRFLPPISLPNSNDEEAWNVKALPLDIYSVPKTSQVINDLMKKRQNQHEMVIKQIKVQFKAINLDIEAQLRLQSELLKQEFQDNENEVQKCMQNMDIEHENMLLLTKDDFTLVSNIILEKNIKCIKAIEAFYIFVQELEKLSSNKYKEVLRQAYEALHKISYILPYEIQQYFEHEILKINQMLLSNFRCYSDLYLQLSLQAENTNRLQMQNLDALNTKWKSIKKKDVLFKLNEKKLVKADCEAIMLQSEQAQIVSKLFSAKEQNMGEMWTRLSPLPISGHDVNLWSSSMQNTVNSLDFFARKLITMYKMAIVQVFDGYFDELQNLTEGMLEMGLVDSEGMSAISLEICKPTIESVTRKYSDELLNLELLWESVITQLQDKLQSTYLFLNSAAHLWDSHFQRLEEAQQIVLKDLKNVIRKNDKVNQDLEIKLNIAVDALRQASSEADLDDDLDDVNDALDNMRKMFNSHYATEVKVIEKYGTLVADEVEVLLAELRQFLHDNPKDADASTQMQKRASQCTETSELSTPGLPQQMKQCEYQVDAVHNWMFGLREAIERYVANCKDEITQQAAQWTAEHARKLAKRLDVKLAIHIPRYARVKFDIYDIRLAELKCHNERIARHKAGAEKEIADIKQFYIVQEIQYQRVTKDYFKKIDKLDSKMTTAKNSNTIKAYIADLNYSTNLCNQKLQELGENQQQIFQSKLANITAASVTFSKQLTLFLEEGNFNLEEAKKITKDLKTFEKSIKKKFTAIMKEINTKDKKMFNQVQQEEKKSLSTLTYSLEEFEYNEKVVAMVKNIQIDIKAEVYNAKILMKNLDQSFKDMKDNGIANLGNVSTFDHFEKNLTQIVSDLWDISNYLHQTEPTTNVSKERFENVSSKKFQKKSQLSKVSKSSDDYATLLFEYQHTENDCFMSKICSNLYKSLQTIQSEAKIFYEMHSEIANENKVQPSYEKFMEEVLMKYIFYHLQCELVWLDLTNDFIRILQQLHEFFISYKNAFLEKHHSFNLDSFNEKYRELSLEVSQINQTNMQILNQIHKKLKPLHGYKNNKYLLEEVQQEMEDVLKHIHDFNIDDIFQPYKESQENHLVSYNSEFTELRDRFAKLYNVFHPLLDVPLIGQFEEKLMHMTTFFDEMSSQYGEDDNEINTTCANITISLEFEKNLKNIKMLLETENEKGNVTYEDDIEQQDLLQRFSNEYNQCISNITSIESTWYEDYETFGKIFKADVQKILKLYSIKYDNP